MAAYRDLLAVKITSRDAASLTGVSRATASRKPAPQSANLPPVEPVNKLSEAERGEVLAVLDSDRFADLAPLQIYGQLLDEGTYLCSVSTMYRILRDNRQLCERRRIARHPARAIPELVATGPGQVYSWDITKLAGPVKGTWYDAYVMIDIFSRYIIGVSVQAAETGPLAVEMMRQAFGIHGTPLILHADRGTSMTSKTVSALLADLHVTQSHSRPKVSNDNPYSEAWFKTLKYSPVFPERFASLGDTRAFMNEFVDGYNHFHHHTGLGLHTPADVHYGLAEGKAAHRRNTLTAARNANPSRFSSNRQPKILNLPEAAWINRPHDQEREIPLAA